MFPGTYVSSRSPIVILSTEKYVETERFETDNCIFYNFYIEKTIINLYSAAIFHILMQEVENITYLVIARTFNISIKKLRNV